MGTTREQELENALQTLLDYLQFEYVGSEDEDLDTLVESSYRILEADSPDDTAD